MRSCQDGKTVTHHDGAVFNLLLTSTGQLRAPKKLARDDLEQRTTIPTQ